VRVTDEQTVNLPSPCVVVLVGPGASGKSTWAARHFAPELVVGSDRLRAVVGSGEDDLAASDDAFALLEQIVAKRVARRLTTVIDTLGLDPVRRAAWVALARAHDLPCVAVAFDTPAAVCRARNRNRDKRIPTDVLAGQLRTWRQVRDSLAGEGFVQVITPTAVRVVPEQFAGGRRAPGGAAAPATVRAAPVELPVRGCGAGATARDRDRRRGGPLRRHLCNGPLPADPAGRAGVG
jgi:predicted kinase